MIGWSDPRNPTEIEAAKELEVPQLPVWEVCPECGGSGRSD
jgi:hypothetical protein